MKAQTALTQPGEKIKEYHKSLELEKLTGDYDKALEYYLKAARIYESVLGENHPDTAASYNNIGNVYSDKGDYDKALEYFKSLVDEYEELVNKK